MEKRYWFCYKDLSFDIFFSKRGKFGFISQLRRAVVSIPSNIAEGAARKSNKEFIQFLYIALGSAAETETQIIIAENLGMMGNPTEINIELENIQKMLMCLIKYLKVNK